MNNTAFRSGVRTIHERISLTSMDAKPTVLIKGKDERNERRVMKRSFQKGFVSDPIRTRSGIVFEIRYRVRNADGTWKHKSERLHGLEGKKAARAVLEERIEEAPVQLPGPEEQGKEDASKHSITERDPKDATMQEFIDQYWNPYLDRMQAKPSTRKSYGSILKHLLPSLGHLRLAQITPLHVEEIVQTRFKEVSAKTLLNELRLLQAIFALAIEEDVVDRCPVVKRHRPKVIESKKPAWTPKEVRRILAALPKKHRALFACVALTGLRIGELLALTWANISFGEQTISVQNSLWNGQIVAQRPAPASDVSMRARF